MKVIGERIIRVELQYLIQRHNIDKNSSELLNQQKFSAVNFEIL